MEKISEAILKFFRLENVFQHLTGYVETKIELVKVEVREDVSKMLSQTLVGMGLFLIFFLFLIFLSLGLAELINHYFEDSYAGPLIMAGFYALTLAILIAFRKNIVRYAESQFSEIIKRKAK